MRMKESSHLFVGAWGEVPYTFSHSHHENLHFGKEMAPIGVVNVSGAIEVVVFARSCLDFCISNPKCSHVAWSYVESTTTMTCDMYSVCSAVVSVASPPTFLFERQFTMSFFFSLS